MNKKFCLSCGEINPEEARFCLSCGEPFRVSSVTGMPLVPVSYESIKSQDLPAPYRHQKRRLEIQHLLTIMLGALVFFSVVVFLISSSNAPSTAPGYAFEAGKTPPKAVSDLIQNRTAVLLFEQYDSYSSDTMNRQFVRIQTQYNNTKVAFATYYVVNRNDSSTSSTVASTYQVNSTPTAVVVRSDGAFVRIAYHSDTDFNAIKGAIDESLQQGAPTPAQCRVCKVTYNASPDPLFTAV